MVYINLSNIVHFFLKSYYFFKKEKQPFFITFESTKRIVSERLNKSVAEIIAVLFASDYQSV